MSRGGGLLPHFAAGRRAEIAASRPRRSRASTFRSARAEAGAKSRRKRPTSCGGLNGRVGAALPSLACCETPGETWQLRAFVAPTLRVVKGQQQCSTRDREPKTRHARIAWRRMDQAMIILERGDSACRFADGDTLQCRATGVRYDRVGVVKVPAKPDEDALDMGQHVLAEPARLRRTRSCNADRRGSGDEHRNPHPDRLVFDHRPDPFCIRIMTSHPPPRPRRDRVAS